MDYGEYEDEQEELKSIVALLLGLAALAEFLCVLPHALRALLLPLLRHAEVVAGTFAVDCAGRSLALPLSLVVPVEDDDCAEALRLARCLRVLASIISLFGSLQDFFASQRPFRGRPGRRPAQSLQATAARRHFMHTRRDAVSGAAVCLDTS